MHIPHTCNPRRTGRCLYASIGTRPAHCSFRWAAYCDLWRNNNEITIMPELLLTFMIVTWVEWVVKIPKGMRKYSWQLTLIFCVALVLLLELLFSTRFIAEQCWKEMARILVGLGNMSKYYFVINLQADYSAICHVSDRLLGFMTCQVLGHRKRVSPAWGPLLPHSLGNEITISLNPRGDIRRRPLTTEQFKGFLRTTNS
jgi:hypothetical protein